jgi:phosphoglycolate phosphatase
LKATSSSCSMHLLFDLDGTLTDSFPGISQSVNHALVDVGREPVSDAQLRPLVGAPLRTIFNTLLGPADLVVMKRVIATYRARFDEVGIFENRVFPGIPEALAGFRTSGHTLQVVTARSAASARHVVRHFALEGYFEAVHGPEAADHACDKADLVLAALRTKGASADEAVMIGDRGDDIRAARAHGVRAIAVRWGYGAPPEIAAAEPHFVAETLADLVAWIQSADPDDRRP